MNIATEFQVRTGTPEKDGTLVLKTTDYKEAKAKFEEMAEALRKGGTPYPMVTLWLWELAMCASYFRGTFWKSEYYLTICKEGGIAPVEVPGR